MKRNRSLHVGHWPAENIFNRAERARVFLAICGFVSIAQAERIRERIKADHFQRRKGKA